MAFAGYKEFAPSSVERMAERREKRVLQQRRLLEEGAKERGAGNRCVVCIGMNIAGPNKRSGLADAAFADAVRCLVQKAGAPAESVLVNENTGIEALFAFDASAERLKEICVEIEETHPAGRLFDMDVIKPSGEKLGRAQPRKCLICAENASVCARSRAHSVAELQMRTRELLCSFLSAVLGELAGEALLSEVNITPKPGLVDRLNNGANNDMTMQTFYRSAEALAPFFARMAALTMEHGARSNGAELPREFFAELKNAGVEAEKAMLAATGGVNTHRGAVYSLGLLVCAAARVLHSGIFMPDESGLYGSLPQGFDLAESITAAAAELAVSLGDNSVSTSNGAKMREKYGVTGPVQQAQSGFPLAKLAKSAKAEYYNRKGGESGELAWAYALISVMAVLDDNNALKRGGKAGAEFVKTRAEELKRLAPAASPQEFYLALLRFDAELIEKNISCGGAADMLALALFLEGAENRFTAPLGRLSGAEKEKH